MAMIDLLLRGARVIDPANGVERVADVGVDAGRIHTIGAEVKARRVIDLAGAIVAPGFIDMHVHCYEWVTNFGLPPDAAGVHSGATTIVDQGSTGAWTLGGFKAFIADPAKTDVRAFTSINLAGALQGGMQGTTLHNPGMVDVPALLAIAAEHPRLVRGIKCHCESGSQSHWGIEVLLKAVEAGRQGDLPLYIHTGELFPVNEANRPQPNAVMAQIVPYLKPGDTLAHVYSCMPDGIMARHEEVPEWIFAAREKGALFDLGHGINFAFDIARKMMAKGLYPDTLGSDVHADFGSYHDFSILNYSLLGGLNKVVALGMPLVEAIRALTATPARTLRDSSIGHLGVGARANITVLRDVPGSWTFTDTWKQELTVASRLLPELVVMDGEPIIPDCMLLSDLMAPDERPRGITRSSDLPMGRR